MDTNCARCGRKVKRTENWLRLHLWGKTAVLHWQCYAALLQAQVAIGVEQASRPSAFIGLTTAQVGK